MLATLFSAIIVPVASKLITWYLEPKLKPVIDTVGDIEKKYTNLSNDLKHDKLLKFIETTPALIRFIDKCGWNMLELDYVIKFCVLMAKKPITNQDSRDRWDDDDLKTVFDFLCVVAGKWAKAFKGKK